LGCAPSAQGLISTIFFGHVGRGWRPFDSLRSLRTTILVGWWQGLISTIFLGTWVEAQRPPEEALEGLGVSLSIGARPLAQRRFRLIRGVRRPRTLCLAGHKGCATLYDGVGSVKGDHERRNGLARSLLASKDLFLSLDQGPLLNPAVEPGSTNQPEVAAPTTPAPTATAPPHGSAIIQPRPTAAVPTCTTRW